MTTLRINADEVLWRNSMLPEGILEAGSSPTATPRTPATLSRRSGSKARCTISSHRSVKMAASEAGRWNLAGQHCQYRLADPDLLIPPVKLRRCAVQLGAAFCCPRPRAPHARQ